MGEESLTPEELDSLLDKAQIIEDQTGQYGVAELEEDYFEEEESSHEEESPIDVQQTSGGALTAQATGDTTEEGIISTVDPKSLTKGQKHNAELLLDIYVGVTVELGRTSIKVKDVLGLGEGSIVELQKPANEPVDLLVNNRLIARGEVVVIDENFGARVTNIVNPMDKLIE